MFAMPLAGSIQPHQNDRSRDRRLRIGYVSPDFTSHPAGRFVLPVLANHDHARFEIFCYSDVQRPDALTQRLASCANVWRQTRGLPDDQLANLIRGDRIDILVDLTMHMARNRLMTFARKPAPVQVTWLGYPGSSGLQTMDWRISDAYLDTPRLNDQFYSERTIRLPHCYWCYDPLVEGMTVSELPAKASGILTLGCLNNFGKVTETTIELWARVLERVPNSRLLALVPKGSARRLLLDRLGARGVAENRLEFTERLPRESYMPLYHRIEISLDTFPYNGHTTSFDSLWMGVPVISLYGQTAVSRGGLSILSNLGLAGWATDDPQRYVEIVESLASNPVKLSNIRSTLRQQMQQSALMDQKRFARGIESLYLQMWESWCRGR
jgi:predicted O-linked N-acetylglucosamine transferase (SPINDLY family)